MNDIKIPQQGGLRSCLELIQSQPRWLSVRGHVIINQSVRKALDAGLVRYDANRRTGYALTTLGRKAVER